MGRVDPVLGQLLHDDACPACGTMMVAKRGKLSLKVNGESVLVPAVPHLKCPDCGEVVIALKHCTEMERVGYAIYREKYNLLSADEIKAIRSKFDLTQAELAQLLRLGANTVSRWESGRNVQSAAMDTVLRMIRDLPGSIEYLRKHAA